MKSKRGQGLPLNTIVIAAIVLIVMVVLIYIFVGGMSQTTTKLGSCADKGGRCSASVTCTGKDFTGDWVYIGKTEDCKGDYDTSTHTASLTPYCCVPLAKE